MSNQKQKSGFIRFVGIILAGLICCCGLGLILATVAEGNASDSVAMLFFVVTVLLLLFIVIRGIKNHKERKTMNKTISDLEARNQQLSGQVAELSPLKQYENIPDASAHMLAIAKQTDNMQVRYDTLCEQCQQIEKKLSAAENRLKKSKAIFQSMQYAMDAFMRPDMGSQDLLKLFEVDLAEVLGDEPELKCLTMKTLRAMYRQNKKRLLRSHKRIRHITRLKQMQLSTS